MFSSKLVLVFVITILMLSSTVTCGLINRNRRAIEDYWYSNGVVHNVVNDGLVGGHTSLGWAQVPHRLSPMFSPVFGGR